MCDDFFDDFDSDHDDGFDEDDFGDDESNGNDSTATEKDDVLWDGPDWEDWMIIGPMSEDIARERRKRDRIRKENENSDDNY